MRLFSQPYSLEFLLLDNYALRRAGLKALVPSGLVDPPTLSNTHLHARSVPSATEKALVQHANIQPIRRVPCRDAAAMLELDRVCAHLAFSKWPSHRGLRLTVHWYPAIPHVNPSILAQEADKGLRYTLVKEASSSVGVLLMDRSYLSRMNLKQEAHDASQALIQPTLFGASLASFRFPPPAIFRFAFTLH